MQIDESLFKHKPKVLRVQNKMTSVCIVYIYIGSSYMEKAVINY